MLYSKNGSIPMPETDGTEGWIEVPDAPVAPDGKEVVWWYPPGWVVRDPQPTGSWAWNQSNQEWVEIAQITEQTQTITTEQTTALTSSQIDML